jgi:hypothetical protein
MEQGTSFPLPADLPLPVDDGAAAHLVEHVFYPVFPPNESAGEVIAWLRAHPLA